MRAAVHSEIRQVARSVAETLDGHGIPNSQLEAEVLLRHALQLDRAQYFASLTAQIEAERIELIHALIDRRISGEPLAYITGCREFYGLEFVVSPSVLIPRQESELLVEIALEAAHDHANSGITIADIGTGSGAIAVAFAANLPGAEVYAIDCSADALAVAEHNRRKHRVSDRVFLQQGDLLDPLLQSVDIIVANPPYIASNLLTKLPLEVQREPKLALDGGEEGTQVISRLLAQAPSKLNDGGCLVVEISPEQKAAVRTLAKAHFPDASISFASDLLGLPRCLVISRK